MLQVHLDHPLLYVLWRCMEVVELLTMLCYSSYDDCVAQPEEGAGDMAS